MNTFLFGSFVLGLVLYNNLYTPYKIKEIHSLAAYLFLFFILMIQLVEYFLWRNLTTEYNLLWSGIGLGLLLVLPFVSLSLITDVVVREWFAVAYVFWVLVLGKLTVEKTVEGRGLEWGFKGYNLFKMGWFFFLIVGPIYVGLWNELYMSFLFLSIGPGWGFINLLFLYYACLLLWVLPFCF